MTFAAVAAGAPDSMDEVLDRVRKVEVHHVIKVTNVEASSCIQM